MHGTHQGGLPRDREDRFDLPPATTIRTGDDRTPGGANRGKCKLHGTIERLIACTRRRGPTARFRGLVVEPRSRLAQRDLFIHTGPRQIFTMKPSIGLERTLLPPVEMAMVTTGDRPQMLGTSPERTRPDIGCWWTIVVDNLD